MKDTASHLRVQLIDSFRVESADGEDLTPTGLKNQALLALLMLTPDMVRPRRWLEQTLWSTFGPDQASASLRQALSKIRASLGLSQDIIRANRTVVWLDAPRITVDVRDAPDHLDHRSELLPGLDVRDPVFQNWLEGERAAFRNQRVSIAQPSATGGLIITCRTDGPDTSGDRLLPEILTNRIGESIAQHVRAWRVDDKTLTDAADPAADILVSTNVAGEGAERHAFVKVVHAPSSRVLFSRLQNLPASGAPLLETEEVNRLIYEASDRVIGDLARFADLNRPELAAASLTRKGVRQLFTFEREAMREAMLLFRQAYDRDHSGLYLGWQGMVRLAQMIERSEPDPLAMRDEALELEARALELDEGNPQIMALASKVRSMALAEQDDALDLARAAVEANPANPFALAVLADNLALMGKRQDALDMCLRARELARSSSVRQWWDIAVCVLATGCFDFDTALAAGDATLRGAPQSRPVLRHLLAIHAQRGEPDKAMEYAARLREVEPSFTLDQMVNDGMYPVRTLRRTGLLEPIRRLL